MIGDSGCGGGTLLLFLVFFFFKGRNHWGGNRSGNVSSRKVDMWHDIYRRGDGGYPAKQKNVFAGGGKKTFFP